MSQPLRSIKNINFDNYTSVQRQRRYSMFHHQKSSKSSEEELEINLLKKQQERRKQRNSRIHFNRVKIDNASKKHNYVNLNTRNRTGSQQQPRLRESDNSYFDDNIVSELQNYSNLAYGGVGAHFSESVLTDTNSNNKCVGMILFLALLAFTPLQTLTFVYIQPLKKHSFNEVLFNILIAEIIVFLVLYYLKWVQSIKFKKQLFLRKRKHQKDAITLIQRIYQGIFTRPCCGTLGILAITILWQKSYCQCLFNSTAIGENIDIQLVFLFITLLPQISTFIYYEDSLLSQNNRRSFIHAIVLFMLIYSLTVDIWLMITSLAGILLILLSMKLGRIVTYIQYLGKLLLLIYVCIDGGSIKIASDIWIRVTVIAVMATSIFLVRCINNKILRVQLYKYFYSDAYINCALLLLPPILGLLDGFKNRYWLIVPYIGIIGLIYVSYLVDKDRYQVKMDAMPSNKLIQQIEMNPIKKGRVNASALL